MTPSNLIQLTDELRSLYRKTAQKLKMSAIFGDAPAGNLENVDYKVAGASKGKIASVGIARRASSY